jgi:hypothetical protein
MFHIPANSGNFGMGVPVPFEIDTGPVICQSLTPRVDNVQIKRNPNPPSKQFGKKYLISCFHTPYTCLDAYVAHMVQVFMSNRHDNGCLKTQIIPNNFATKRKRDKRHHYIEMLGTMRHINLLYINLIAKNPSTFG